MLRWLRGLLCFFVYRAHVPHLPPYEESRLPEYEGRCLRCAWSCTMVMDADQWARWERWFERRREAKQMWERLGP
jgi:hypothetical protein